MRDTLAFRQHIVKLRLERWDPHHPLPSVLAKYKRSFQRYASWKEPDRVSQFMQVTIEA